MGKTILVSSHILPELAAICSTVGILDHGKLLAAGPVGKVMRGIRQNRLVEVHVMGGAETTTEFLRQGGEKIGIANLERDGNMIRFEWTANDAQLADLLADLVHKGHKVLSFQEVPISLEEAFMRLTGNAPHPEGQSKA